MDLSSFLYGFSTGILTAVAATLLIKWRPRKAPQEPKGGPGHVH